MPHLLKIGLFSLNVNENVLGALGAVDSTRLVCTPNLEAAGANGPNGSRYVGKLAILTIFTNLGMLLSSLLAKSLHRTRIAHQVHILFLDPHFQIPLVLQLEILP